MISMVNTLSQPHPPWRGAEELLLQSHISVWSAPSHSLTISTPHPHPRVVGRKEVILPAQQVVAKLHISLHHALWPREYFSFHWENSCGKMVCTAGKDYTVNELIFLSKPNRIICPLSLYFLVKVLICQCRLFFSSQEESLTVPLRNKNDLIYDQKDK